MRGRGAPRPPTDSAAPALAPAPASVPASDFNGKKGGERNKKGKKEKKVDGMKTDLVDLVV
eukprot:2632512-Rhodomonas_salina.1